MQLKTIHVVEDSLSPDVIHTFSAEHIGLSVKAHFTVRPSSNLRIYRGTTVCLTNDITPVDAFSLDLLEQETEVTVVVYPAEPATILYIVTLVISVALAVLMQPKVPELELGRDQGDSPNNSVGGRQNKARPKERIPDIFGKVRSTPDLIAVPYRRYSADTFRETEYSLMCIGKGEYEIDVDSIKEGNTPISQIKGYSLQVYNPEVQVGYDEPTLRIGSTITEDVRAATQIRTITGQSVNDPNVEYETPTPDYADIDDLIANVSDGQVLENDLAPLVPNNFDLANGLVTLTSLDLDILIDLTDITITDNGSEDAIGNIFNGFIDRAITLSNTSMYTDVNRSAVEVMTVNLEARDSGAYKMQFQGPAANAMIQIGDTVTLSGTLEWTHPVDGLVVFDYSGAYTIVSKSAWVSATDVVVAAINPDLTSRADWDYYTDSGSPGRFPPVMYDTALLTDISVTISRNNYNPDFTLGPNDIIIIKDLPAVNSIQLEIKETVTNFGTGGGTIDIPGSHPLLTMYSITGYPTYTNPGYGAMTWAGPVYAQVSMKIEMAVLEPVNLGTIDLDDPDLVEILVNVVAPSGLYRNNGGTETILEHTIELVLKEAGGAEYVYPHTIKGSVFYKSSLKWSLSIRVRNLRVFPSKIIAASGPCSLLVREIVPAAPPSGAVDYRNIQTLNGYLLRTIDRLYERETVVYQSVTADPISSVTEERLLGMDVTRKVPTVAGGATLAPTSQADLIIAAVALDPYIGGMELVDLDTASLSQAITDVGTYFGDSVMGEFNFTFDDANLSAEETIATIAQCVFCGAYRANGKLGLWFERDLEVFGENVLDVRLVLGSHNTVPESEVRSYTVGTDGNNDGVTITWNDITENDVELNYNTPVEALYNPQTLEYAGIRNERQAQVHADRVWNKKLYQHEGYEVTVTHEGVILKHGDLIGVATPGVSEGNPLYNRRKMSGTVVYVDGLKFHISPKMNIEANMVTVLIQGRNGQIQQLTGAIYDSDRNPGEYSMFIANGDDTTIDVNYDELAAIQAPIVVNSVTGTPSKPRTNYLSADADGMSVYRVNTIETEDGLTFKVTASEYRDIYYQNDQDGA